MYACRNQTFFFTFPISKELYIQKKKWWTRLFKLYQTLFIYKKFAADDDAYLGWAGQKFDFFVQKSWFFCNSKHFLQKIMTPCYSCYFCIFYIFNCFQIIMVSLFFAFHDQYFMFKSSNIFEATNFPFKTKYVTVVYSVNRNCLFSRGKLEKKLLKQFFDTLYLLMFRQNSMIFEGSPNSLTKSYFPGESRLGET